MSALMGFGWGLAVALMLAAWDIRKLRFRQIEVDKGFAQVIRMAVADGNTGALTKVADALEDPTKAAQRERLDHG